MNNLEHDIRAIVANMESQESHEQQTPPDEVQDIYVLIVREQGDDHTQIVDSTPAPVTTQQDSFFSAYVFVCFSIFVILSTLTFQLYSMFNPPIATITILPKSQQVTLNGTLQLGRVLQPITISQSQTIATTGHGHQDARASTGYITLYNGQLNSIFVPAGLIVTGSDGVQIVTDQDASIPAANLPQVGQVTVSAYAMNAGSKGNIPAYDINEACCATAIKAVNTSSFSGGQDQRDFSTVSQQDINKISTPLKISLAKSLQGALQGQATSNEHLQIMPCTPQITSDHFIGTEATQVKVTVSETCSAVAYNTQELETTATALLTVQALKKLGAGYSLFGDIQISVKQASTTHNLVFLSIKATGTWIYGLSSKAQELIKKEIEGKTKDQALHILAAIPGIERGSISFTGFMDDTRLPKDSRHLHIILIVM